jgi:hypothetical protein
LTAHREIDGVGIAWVIVQATLGFGVHQLDLKRAGEARNHFVLELEQVRDVFLESIRPDMRAGFCVNETVRGIARAHTDVEWAKGESKPSTNHGSANGEYWFEK